MTDQNSYKDSVQISPAVPLSLEDGFNVTVFDGWLTERTAYFTELEDAEWYARMTAERTGKQITRWNFENYLDS